MQPVEAEELLELGKAALQVEATAMLTQAKRMGKEFAEAIELFCRPAGKIILTGVGKSGHVARKIASTFSSIGRPAWFVHPSEASHGDLGMIASEDVLLAVSNSGESAELRHIIHFCETLEIPIVALVGNGSSTLAQRSKVTISYGPVQEVCPIGLTPTTSTTLCMAIGDALAVGMMSRLGITQDHFRRFHPGGKLGIGLLTVRDLMHIGDRVPIVHPATSMRDVILTISTKGFGVAIVADQPTGALGIITDGDMRRHIDGLWDLTAAQVATMNPVTVDPDMPAEVALATMSEHAITSLIVELGNGGLGLLHIHDCLRAGL